MLEQFYSNNWKYYLNIEKQLISILDFISLDEKNYNVFSNKLADILILSCIEIEALLTSIDDKYDGKNADNFAKLKNICTHDSRIENCSINFVWKPKLSLLPFADSTKRMPLWFQVYNQYKHGKSRRIEVSQIFSYNKLHVLSNESVGGVNYYYELTTLKNVLNALGALYILEFTNLEFYVDKKSSIIIEGSQLFNLINDYGFVDNKNQYYNAIHIQDFFNE